MTRAHPASEVPADELEAILPSHVGHQRWYGGAADDDVKLLHSEVLDPPWPGLVRAVLASPAGDRYQAFLGLRQIGTVDVPLGVAHLADGDAVWVDATTDPELALMLLRHVDRAQDAATARPVGSEQSNTSIVYDERVILKLFRRLVGTNPEVEVTGALARAGFPHVARPLAVWHDDEEGDDLAVLQPFLAGGIEGWALALTSLRALLDEGGDPAASGADFAPEAGRLGEVTALMHLAFADAFGTAPAVPAEWVESIRDRVRSADVPGLDSGAVDGRLAELETAADAGISTRIHGDFHLGQVMRTDEGWFVLDFEGEPTRPVEERRRPSSPFRDVAGMLRSFSYAAAVAVRERGEDGPASGLAARWEARNRDAFVAAYLDGLAGSPLLPGDPAVTFVMIDAFELDKAIYEVAYEAAHRPDWVEIPLAAVRRLVDRQ